MFHLFKEILGRGENFIEVLRTKNQKFPNFLRVTLRTLKRFEKEGIEGI